MSVARTAGEAHGTFLRYLDKVAVAGADADTDGKDRFTVLDAIGVSFPPDCPTSIMPRWLAQMVAWFCYAQERSELLCWGEAFYSELARLDGRVPFSVVFDWQARIVGQLAIGVAQRYGGDKSAFTALLDLQSRALAGEKLSRTVWRPVLEKAFVSAYSYANRDGGELSYYGVAADLAANAFADAYATEDPIVYAEAYLFANAETDADSYADAHADADAFACASADVGAFDATYRRVYASHVARLAIGMLECLKRAHTPS